MQKVGWQCSWWFLAAWNAAARIVDGSKGSDTNTSSYHHQSIKAPNFLSRSTEGTGDLQNDCFWWKRACWTRLTIVSPDWAGLSSLPEVFRPKSLGPWSSVPSDASDTCDTLGVLKTTGLFDSVHLLYSINIGDLGGLASFKSTPAACAGASCVRRFRKAEHQSRVFGARMWTLMQFSSGAEVSVKGCHSPFQPSRMYWPAWYAKPWGSSKVSPITSLGKSFTLLRCK